ncbi:MAG: hypothetical protein K2O14_00800 [Oscillospiraceae bacterium]|nr:hypothetical protein [Oscillospiraceae bacterium]
MNFTKRTPRVLAGIFAVSAAVGITGCSERAGSSAADICTAEADTTEIFSAELQTVDSTESTEEAEILFSDSFDYDGDGYEEEIFLTPADNSQHGTVPIWYSDDPEGYSGYVSVWYADESGEKCYAEIGTDMIERYGSSAVSVFDSGGQHFVSISTDIAMGLGVPTVCMTVRDNIPVQVGNTAELNINDQNRHTIFTVLGGIPYVRDCGPTAGTNNLYPLYWDGAEFRIYETSPSDMDFVRNADIKNIVPELENVINVLVRSNGLLHINYYADHTDIPTESGIGSVTYVLEDNIITEKYDMREVFGTMPEGIYREVMPVRDSDLNIIE